jgi:hypothetical protein
LSALSKYFRSSRVALLAVIFARLLVADAASADPAAFDLIGPKVEVRVQREGQTLPIAEVPTLQEGDRLWVHPDLPDSQSVHYLLIVAFLRGATNPPPDSWFTRVEAWSRPVHEEGVYVVVPEGAEEAILLLAPDTGGAFSSLRTAVKGKPGAFVRAAQDLEQASLDRARLEKYLEVVRESSGTDPELKARTTLLARSLNMRLEQQCFDKPTAQQVPCLTQNTDQLVLDDSHSQTMAATLTSGTSTDLLAQVSSTPTARGGYYSPYIGAIVDVVRILSTAHTAQYQYIPALALPKQDQLNLRLNNPPSFRNPKSVLVIGLPPVKPAPLPALRAVADSAQVFCASQPALILPIDGAPLVFATQLGHNFVLHVETKSASGIDLPARPDPALGGFAVETRDLPADAFDGEVTGILRGTWGFHAFEGPRFRLRSSRPALWIVPSKDASALIVGREDILHLQAADTSCVSEVILRDEQGRHLPAEWKVAKADELEVRVGLQESPAGSLTMTVKKFGLRDADEVRLHTYAEAARLDGFAIHAGDSFGVLKGTRLDQVMELDTGNLHFKPETLSRANQQDELSLVVQEAAPATLLKAGDPLPLRITLKDGRLLELKSAVGPSRPSVSIMSKSVQYDPSAPPSPFAVRLGDTDELPQEARLNFFLKSQSPDSFSATEKVEVATADESFRVLLSFKEGNLTLQDSKTVFAVLDPMKLLGPSAFGPLKFRPVAADGVEGDWQPLINLVRVPALKGVRCLPGREKQCTLSGDKLFLIDVVSTDPDFDNSVTVPDGFAEATLVIPPMKGKTLYLKLRDDPSTVDTAVLPTLPSAQ